MSHLCPDCGLEHGDAQVAVAETEPIAEASVEVARIEAERDVTIARLSAKTEREVSENDLQGRIAELEGQLVGMAATLATLAPTQPMTEEEPTPVIVDEPEPEPAMPEPVAAAPPVVDEPPARRKKSNPWWG